MTTILATTVGGIILVGAALGGVYLVGRLIVKQIRKHNRYL